MTGVMATKQPSILFVLAEPVGASIELRYYMSARALIKGWIWQHKPRNARMYTLTEGSIPSVDLGSAIRKTKFEHTDKTDKARLDKYESSAVAALLAAGVSQSDLD
jgi:hypothetical protein